MNFSRHFLIGLFLISVSVLEVNSQINFPFGSSYKYLKGSDASSLASDWMDMGFDDSGWSTSDAPFRYGDGTGGTELIDMQGNYTTLYLRSAFTVSQLENIQNINISADWDDGFVLFINGNEVMSRQAPDYLVYDALASDLHEFNNIETIVLSKDEITLNEGENTIAVFACNITLGESSDFYFDLGINASAVEPGLPQTEDSIGVSFSHPSGFYNSVFTLTLSTSEPNSDIVYTLDGSNPQNSDFSVRTDSIAQISINPNDLSLRGATPGVVVRASIVKDGLSPSRPNGRTYLFVNEVKNQNYPGWDWPSYNIKNQVIDYEVDAKVTESVEYADLIDDALLDIPTISIITDNKNLFDPDTGIYVNAMQQGDGWERDCTVELINPDGSAGFNINAGLRIRGGWSRHPEYAKHAFRLFFRTEYGAGKLDFPLFGNEGVDHFDKVDLRCAQNYSWNNGGGTHNTFIREVFLRDAQGETGSPYTRSRYYHLYLNGAYWGLFQSQERSEARYASDYFGGKNEDWDVVKVGGFDDVRVVATDGNTDKWEEVWNITEEGYEGNENYFLLEGRNIYGQPMKKSEILVDIDNLIDYMVNVFYSGNFDAPVSKFRSNDGPNNFYALKQRDDKTRGFFFMVHDAEHALMYEPASPGIGIDENRVNIGYIEGSYNMNITTFNYFSPQWLHHKLADNNEYKSRFANIAYKRLNPDYGLFSEKANIDRLDARAEQIDMAIIAESARWGDTKSPSYAFTKADWENELDVLRYSYFPQRGDIVIEQLREYGLYPEIDPPNLYIDGINTYEEYIPISGTVNLKFNSSHDIYYTIDGRDPRGLNDIISGSAIKIESNVNIPINESAIIKVRALDGDDWSAMREINLIKEQVDFSNFKVTELHYHPIDSIVGVDTINGSDFEFIEFKNIGYDYAINLSGVKIDSAINFVFPENTLLPPQQYYVVAAKPKKFYARYGMLTDGNFSKSFSNAGEQVLVNSRTGDAIIDFTYFDTSPWPLAADGGGASLTSVEENPTGNPNDYTYWTASKQLHGNPIPKDAYLDIEDTSIESIAKNISIYPNPTNNIFYVEYGADDFESAIMEIYDINGKLLMSRTVQENSPISLMESSLKYGVYVIKIKARKQTRIGKLIYMP